MSIRASISSSIQFACLHCEGWNDIELDDVSITIEGTDTKRSKTKFSFVHECEHCGGKFKVVPHMDIACYKV